jgi:hypothetical protein
MKPDGDSSQDEEAVRLTAYFLWQQEGRPDSDPREFWKRAAGLHQRAQHNGTQIEAGLSGMKRGAPRGTASPPRSPGRRGGKGRDG